jgi:hypothetical protein
VHATQHSPKQSGVANSRVEPLMQDCDDCEMQLHERTGLARGSGLGSAGGYGRDNPRVPGQSRLDRTERREATASILSILRRSAESASDDKNAIAIITSLATVTASTIDLWSLLSSGFPPSSQALY